MSGVLLEKNQDYKIQDYSTGVCPDCQLLSMIAILEYRHPKKAYFARAIAQSQQVYPSFASLSLSPNPFYPRDRNLY